MRISPIRKVSVHAAVSVGVRSVTRGSLLSVLGGVSTTSNATIIVRITANRIGTVAGVKHVHRNICNRSAGRTITSRARPNSAFGITSVVITLRSNIYRPNSAISINGNVCVCGKTHVASRGGRGNNCNHVSIRRTV